MIDRRRHRRRAFQAKSHPPRSIGRWAARSLLAGGALIFGGASGATFACVRHADIRDEPDASDIDIEPIVDAGDIPELDSGLGSDAYMACSERPLGECYGTLDFPCGFEGWVLKLAESCFKATGCKANGWVEVKMGQDGCVLSIGMDQPNAEILDCMVPELGAVQCPCMGGEISHFFGLGNKGPCPQ